MRVFYEKGLRVIKLDPDENLDDINPADLRITAIVRKGRRILKNRDGPTLR